MRSIAGAVAMHIDAPLDERPPSELDERLGTRSSKTLAEPGGDDQRNGQAPLLGCDGELARRGGREQLVEVALGLVLVLVERVHQL